MSKTEANPVRKWRIDQKISLDEMRKLFADHQFEAPSIAKLSRIERDQSIPLDMLPQLELITGIPATKLRPDLVRLLFGEAQ
jgi:hypothetical protein